MLNRSTHHLQKLGVRTEIKKEGGGGLYNFQSSCSAYRKKRPTERQGGFHLLILSLLHDTLNSSYYIPEFVRIIYQIISFKRYGCAII